MMLDKYLHLSTRLCTSTTVHRINFHETNLCAQEIICAARILKLTFQNVDAFFILKMVSQSSWRYQRPFDEFWAFSGIISFFKNEIPYIRYVFYTALKWSRAFTCVKYIEKIVANVFRRVWNILKTTLEILL